jgi:hypothetical protein
MPQRRGLVRTLLFVALAATVTLIMQEWVGEATIYGSAMMDRRAELHQALMSNEPPPGATWRDLGSNGANIRIAAVRLAEWTVRYTPLDLRQAYKAIDSVFLFLSLVLLFVLLAGRDGPAYALIGTLYLAMILPLTYFLHYMQPWDRMSLLTWIAGIWLVAKARPGWLALWLVFGMIVKFDIVMLPGLYFLAWADRTNWKKIALHTGLLFALTFGIYFLLNWFVPYGTWPRDILAIMRGNVEAIRMHGLAYPPLLAFGLPMVLAAIGFRTADRFARACVVFALGLLGILFVLTNFQEIRAEVPEIVLLLPAALHGLRRLLEPIETAAATLRPQGGGVVRASHARGTYAQRAEIMADDFEVRRTDRAD